MDQMANDIRVLAEAYPELRTNTAFVKLQDAIASERIGYDAFDN